MYIFYWFLVVSVAECRAWFEDGDWYCFASSFIIHTESSQVYVFLSVRACVRSYANQHVWVLIIINLIGLPVFSETITDCNTTTPHTHTSLFFLLFGFCFTSVVCILFEMQTLNQFQLFLNFPVKLFNLDGFDVSASESVYAARIPYWSHF